MPKDLSRPKPASKTTANTRPDKTRSDKTRPNKPAHKKPGHKKPAPQRPGQKTYEGERIAKVIARAGLCSRRDAEAWIAQGRVAVNGKVLESPAINIGPKDKVSVDGKPLAQRERTRLFLFHKPRGLVTTNKDPEGRPTIFDFLQEHAPDVPRLMSVGRLDINTEGLLLLTNDGGLARILELPTTGWLRRYRVRANGETHQGALDDLAKGITIDGIRYAGIEATFERQQGANCWLTMGLREGKNREIKRVLEHLGLTVNRLIRISYGPFQLGELPEGKIEEVRTRILRDQLGNALAEAAGVDFDSPVAAEAEDHAPSHGRAARDPRPGTRSDARPARPPAKGGRNAPRPKRAQPEPEAPKHRPQPGPRKHISALRSDENERDGKRRRIETSETTDRKGRAVTIERHVAAKPARAAHRAESSAAVRTSRPNEQQDHPRQAPPEWKCSEQMRPPRKGASSKTQRSDAYQAKSDRPKRQKADWAKSDRRKSDHASRNPKAMKRPPAPNRKPRGKS